jgi:hypothetical protein
MLIRVTDGVIVRPGALTVVVTPCAPAAAAAPVELRVLGTAGALFSAVVDAGPAAAPAGAQDPQWTPQGVDALNWEVRNVPWITAAQSPTSTVPSAITLALNPAGGAPFNQAHVTVTAQLGGQTLTRTANISLICTDFPLFLPSVQRLAWPR